MGPGLVLMGFTAGLVLIVWIILDSRRRTEVAKVQRDMYSKLLEKFGTTEDLMAYLKSEAGSRFLDSATIQQARPFGRILGSVQAGLILFLLGIAVLFVRLTMPSTGFMPIEQAETAHALLAISLLLLALGIGFLASAGASYWLSKSWGLLERSSSLRR